MTTSFKPRECKLKLQGKVGPVITPVIPRLRQEDCMNVRLA